VEHSKQVKASLSTVNLLTLHRRLYLVIVDCAFKVSFSLRNRLYKDVTNVYLIKSKMLQVHVISG
jgi:hypothetical protein